VKGSVTVHFATSPADVWDLVSDVTRIGEFSPETFEAQWLTEGPRVGARFRGHVRRNGRGPVYWTTCTVVASDPGREFAFTVNGPGAAIINTWRYRLEPSADGTDVTESFELPGTLPHRLYWGLAGRARMRTNLNGMRVTLEKMRAIAERGNLFGHVVGGSKHLAAGHGLVAQGGMDVD
jgi:uncharacterized protein YndB with AHSA1/START domain